MYPQREEQAPANAASVITIPKVMVVIIALEHRGTTTTIDINTSIPTALLPLPLLTGTGEAVAGK